tara:strand:+ start:119 stop:574 length:456 start_codon:yes stop_codon:yes gene_type:complete
MTSTSDAKAYANVIKHHEGCRLDMYQDTADPPVWTIGYGHNIDEGIDQETAEFILERDLLKHMNELDKHKPWWRELPFNSRVVVLSMQFNMGWPRFSKFFNFWKYLSKAHLTGKAEFITLAAKEMQDSVWWTQIGRRGPDLKKLLLETVEK